MRALYVNESLSKIYEDFGQKDLVRMQDIQTKAAGDFDKEISLATTQANIIQDAGKAKARAEAAEQVFGINSDVALIFNDRAVQLGGSYVKSNASAGALAPVVGPKIKGEKLKREFKKNYVMPSEKIKNGTAPVIPQAPAQGGFFQRGIDPKKAMSTGVYADAPEIGGGYHGESYISPLGKVQLGTGECRYFNVKKTWETGTVEIWQTREGKKKAIFTSRDKPSQKIDDRRDFRNDQTFGYIGHNWKLIDYAPIKELSELIRLYGASLSGYVYK